MEIKANPGKLPPSQPTLEERVDEAARMYEKQFLREMVKAMRSSVANTTKPSQAEELYREQLDDQYVESWGDQGGLGFHKIIQDQLMEMLNATGAGKASGKFANKHLGPLPLTQRDIINTGRPNAQSLRVDLKPEADGKAAALNAPISGVLVGLQKDGEETSLQFEHANLEPGIKPFNSTLRFRGSQIPGLGIGTSVRAGERVGILSPDAQAFFLNIQKKEL